jgi:molybdopterin-containing oxidoreductase family membrane subunit
MTRHYKILKNSSPGYWLSLGILLALALAGTFAAHYMDSNGHWVTGMNNQVVWGVPHVFAILLILSASGALNVASMGSVFGQPHYQPWARLSSLLAIALLMGGLLVLVLDLGRPERLIVAMTHYNFRSVFAWNILLYSGFFIVVVIYLWVQFEHGLNRYRGKVGLLAFIWRIVLTSATGAIFGFLVARQLYDAAMMIPVFIVLSLVLGTALFVLVAKAVSCWTSSQLDQTTLDRLGRLLGIFIAVELSLVLAFHLTNLYAAEHRGIEFFILAQGGVYTILFWGGQVSIGAVIPMWLVFSGAANKSPTRIVAAAATAVVGAGCQLYVLIIGGQAYPQLLFPGKSLSSTFYDGVVAHYAPSLPEFLLGIGGAAVAMLILAGVLRVLPLLPDQRG